MHALCQINLKEFPWHPPRLKDLEFITIFVGPDRLPTDGINGANWCPAGLSVHEFARTPRGSGHGVNDQSYRNASGSNRSGLPMLTTILWIVCQMT